MTCPHCNSGLTLSSIYFVDGIAKCGRCARPLDIEIEQRTRDAQPFAPIVLHKNAATGEYSFPGAADDPLPAGYSKVEIRTLHEADKLTRKLSADASAEKRDNIRAEQNYWDQRNRDLRSRVDAELKRRGIRSSQLEAVRKYVDEKRRKKYAAMLNKEVNVFSQVLSFDSSNRQTHSSERTNWKTKRA